MAEPITTHAGIEDIEIEGQKYRKRRDVKKDLELYCFFFFFSKDDSCMWILKKCQFEVYA